MNRIYIVLLLLLPIMAFAATLHLSVDLSAPVYNRQSNSFENSNSTYGTSTAVGKWQLPVKAVNIVLPAGAEILSYDISLGSAIVIPAAEPRINPAFQNSERTLNSQSQKYHPNQYSYLGLKRWGDIHYASFKILPATYNAELGAYKWSEKANLSIHYEINKDNARNYLPQTLKEHSLFSNPEALSQWYRKAQNRTYDYLIVTMPTLYAISDLETFRQSQGLITSVAWINDILASSPGSNDAEKLRNYLIQEYETSPFTYLLLVGDHDIIPTAMLTPEPDGYDTIPSDFYYSDLSSNFDSDNDGRLGEYSTGFENQDWEMDFTPEIFVGRISSNQSTSISNIALRTVAFEQNTGAWKNKALLPAAFLNYAQEESNMEYEQTDGALFMELIKETVLSGMETTTMYEQLGVVPSYPSDYDLDYDILKARLNSESFGLLNWSAHGSATSSSRKVWMEDVNADNIPDSYEMEWLSMVNRSSFDNLSNTDGMVVFCASCYNGQIDHTSASLAEQVLIKKGVNSIGATRTGWYKIGWLNPGWGGLSSYNYHFLENYVTHGMSVGAAHAYTNLLHTQYYLFGDPIDSGGIIWPELQNVYTYLLYGDPAVGHSDAIALPEGEILVWEPVSTNGLPIVNAINALGNFNVVYTDKLIPDYQYLENFEAVFCLLGYGDNPYTLEINGLEYNLLNNYLDAGGKLYFEGECVWDDTDPFFAKFGANAPYDHVAHIEGIRHPLPEGEMNWDYCGSIEYTQALATTTGSAIPIFFTDNTEYLNDTIGIWNSDGNYRSIASSFQLYGACEPTYSLLDMVAVVLDTLNVGETTPVSNNDPQASPIALSFSTFPNPFSSQIQIKIKGEGKMNVDIYNLRGQKILSQKLLPTRDSNTFVWNAMDKEGRKTESGIYFVRVSSDKQSLVKKVILIR